MNTNIATQRQRWMPGFIALALLTATLATHAQTWQILLPSPVPGAAPMNLGRDVIINPFTSSPAPGIFLSTEKGSWSDGPTVPSIFRLTPTDATSSQFTIEAVDGALAGASRLAYNPGGSSSAGLYTAGFDVTISGSKGRTTSLQTWKVRRSPLAGQGNLNSWGEDDSFNLTTVTKGKTTVYDARAYGITTDDLGNVYACGSASDGRVNHWIIRKKSTTGWANVYDVASADGYSIPYDVCFVPQGGNNPAPALLLVGLLNNRWTVLRSVDRGASWQEPAQARWPSDGSLASAYDVASDSQGNIYVVGVRGRDGQNRGWVLRRSTDGGTNWETKLDQASADDSWAVRLSIDASDTITLAGAIDGANGSPRWAIVRNLPGQEWSGSPTASWETRVFPLGANTPSLSKGRGMVTDANGNMFLTGDVINWTDPEDNTFYSGTRVGLLRLVP